MKTDIKLLLGPAIALAILAVILTQTVWAIRSSGAWETRHPRTASPVSPYARLDQMLERGPATANTPTTRNPFAYGTGQRPSTEPARPRPVAVVVPERPMLTSIVFDADPRATIRFGGREYSVRESALFDEFVVTSITRDQVTLRRNGETLVLQLQRKGE
jgi:hypothetical protein